MEMAKLKHLEGVYNEAMEYFNRVLRTNPKETHVLIELYYNIGLTFLRMDKIDDAILSFE